MSAPLLGLIAPFGRCVVARLGPVMSALLLGIAVAAPSLVKAQDTEIGSRLTPRQTTAIQHDQRSANRQSLFLFRCIARKRPSQTRLYLDATDPSVIRKLRGPLMSPVICSDLLDVSGLATEQQVKAPEELVRGMLAEGMLREESPPMPATEPLGRVYSNDWSSLSQRGAVVDEMATCVAATNPAGIRELVMTDPGSVEGNRAIAKISPSLGQCLAINAKLIANRQQLRAALAEGLYHRVFAPVAAVAGSKP